VRVHRFFVGEDFKLKQDFWLHDEELLWQWNRVLRFSAGQNVVLFDGVTTDRLYEIVEISKTEAHLKLKTELEQNLPKIHIYLLWSLLKKDNNEHILQKCTELGVSNFVPIISERTIRTNFNIDRAKKIIVEASEQCGRSDIPRVREPMHLTKAIDQYKDKIELIVCDSTSEHQPVIELEKEYGLLIGPEGGWSNSEQELFNDNYLAHMQLSNHTLRSETAAIVAVSKLL